MAAKRYSSNSFDFQIQDITKCPTNWRYTPVGDRKNPILKNWPSNPLTSQELLEQYSNDYRVQAVGLLTGELSGGILAVDHDGASCGPLIKKLSGLPVEIALPKTVGVTSGRPGRYQAFYWISEMWWPYIEQTVVKTGSKDEFGKQEQLEFRWIGHQSVILGKHPSTGSYQWLPDKAPWEIAVAECPEWMLLKVLRFDKGSPKNRNEWTDRDWALSYLSAIPPEEDYDAWIEVGMALKSVDEDLLDIWDLWSSLAYNYESDICEEKWDSFYGDEVSIGTLGFRAKQNGWKGKSPLHSDPEYEFTPSIQEEVYEDDQQEELNTLITEGNSSPPILFSEVLANPLANLAHSLGLPVEAYCVCILPILASRLKVGTQLAIDPTTDYYASTILWAGLVGESGTLKTPILKALTKPLDEIQNEEFTNYQQLKTLYEFELQQWNSLQKKDKGDTPQPQPPALKDLYFSDFTIEAIADSINLIGIKHLELSIVIQC